MKSKYKCLLLIAWMIVIFLLSNEVADTSSVRSGAIVGVLKDSLNLGIQESVLTFLTRKAAHIFAYFVLGILAYNLIKEYVIRAKHAILLSIAFALAYATSDEIHQLFVPGRSGEIRDVLIDTTASAVGIGIYYLIFKKLAKRRHSK